MPTTEEQLAQVVEAVARSLHALQKRNFGEVIQASIKQNGFTPTLKSLKKGRFPASGMRTVVDGVVEQQASGLYDAALQTDEGPLVLRNARRTDREATDAQVVSSNDTLSSAVTADADSLTPSQLLRQLTDAGPNPPGRLICQVELARFGAAQLPALLPLLWQYILNHRNSNSRDELVAVGAAIRKYIATMPMDQMETLGALLESGHRSLLPMELEIEVAKMVYRNFEVHPPLRPDPQPDLAKRLWEMVQAYINPRILLRDKHAAIASLAIEAIVAMRSILAERAWRAAVECPCRWFAELVSDDIEQLRNRWSQKSPEAASWLAALQKDVAAAV